MPRSRHRLDGGIETDYRSNSDSNDALKVAELPPASEGWSDRAKAFACTFSLSRYSFEHQREYAAATYSEVGEGPDDPDPIEWPIERASFALESTGRLPARLSLDDLRAILATLAWLDSYVPVGSTPRLMRVYFATLDAIRARLLARPTQGRVTRAGRRNRCPNCGSRDVGSIFYGMPRPDYDESEEHLSGELVAGGCLVFPNQPKFHCHACQTEWRPGHTFDRQDGSAWSPAGDTR